MAQLSAVIDINIYAKLGNSDIRKIIEHRRYKMSMKDNFDFTLEDIYRLLSPILYTFYGLHALINMWPFRQHVGLKTKFQWSTYL